MHSTETVFAGSITTAAILALIGLVIRESVASFMWAAFVCIARYFFKRCFLKSIFLFERDTLKSYNSKGICPFYVKFGEQLV